MLVTVCYTAMNTAALPDFTELLLDDSWRILSEEAAYWRFLNTWEWSTHKLITKPWSTKGFHYQPSQWLLQLTYVGTWLWYVMVIFEDKIWYMPTWWHLYKLGMVYPGYVYIALVHMYDMFPHPWAYHSLVESLPYSTTIAADDCSIMNHHQS